MDKKLTHRERVLRAINHKQPDRVPLDLGSTVNSSIHLEEYVRLAENLGIQPKKEIIHRMMQTANVQEEVLQNLDIDLRGIFLGVPDKSLAEDLGPNEYRDVWGCVRVRPPGSYYYDLIQFPLQGDISLSDIVKYPWPNPDDPGWTRHLRGRLKWIREKTDCAVVLAVPTACVHVSQYLRGFQDWFLDFIRNPNLLEALFDAILEINSRTCENILKEIGGEVDIVATADDLGAQNGLQISPAHYKKFVHPRLAKYFRLIHDLTPAKLHFHTCGSVAAIIEDLIQIGVDILNPVQVSAAGMEPGELKRKYGDRLVFWGAIDTQHVLPHGSVEDVKKEVELRVEQLGREGGYILGAVHDIQPDVPLDNILGMFRHAQEYRPSFSN
jgi:uroporphyrinogen decarboxylase